ncbi:MAG: CheY-like chemotaxis protein [Gammaproteobacteria bacterium]|jgi:CheY-like chemotaxis protein
MTAKSRARILIVDDHDVNIAILEQLLDADYEVKSVMSGEETIELARIFHPDLVLLDVMMSGIGGFETCRRMRQDPETVDMKIVMVTAAATAADRQRGVDCGSDDFVAKPFGLVQMKLKVDSIVLEVRGEGG